MTQQTSVRQGPSRWFTRLTRGIETDPSLHTGQAGLFGEDLDDLLLEAELAGDAIPNDLMTRAADERRLFGEPFDLPPAA